MRRYVAFAMMAVGSFALGWGVCAARAGAIPKSRTPEKIGISIPDGAGERITAHFTVTHPPYTQSDVLADLAPDESVVVLVYFRPELDRYDSVSYRGKVKSKSWSE
jgi:hypothetical protein